MKAIGKRLVVRREIAPEKKNGLFTPESAAPVLARGLVVSVGNLVKELSADDIIIFSKYAGTEAEEGGETVLILNEDEVLAIV